MDEGRSGLLSAGGILSILVGAFEITTAAMMVALVQLNFSISFLPPRLLDFLGLKPGFEMPAMSTWLIIVVGVLAVTGIIAVVGGISAIKRRRFGLSLAGAICAFLPVNTLGLLALIFVSLGKREFE